MVLMRSSPDGRGVSMTDEEFLRFYVESLKSYLELWDFPEARDEAGVSRESAAYYILDYAGKLYRYTADERCLTGLVEQTEHETREMVLAACEYISDVILANSARHLLQDRALHPDEILQIEDIMLRRDTLETVLWLAAKLSAQSLEQGNDEVRRALARARCVAAEIDDVLLARQDVVSIASQALSGVYERIKTPPELKQQWWFAAAHERELSFEEELEEELGLTGLIEAAANTGLFEYRDSLDSCEELFTVAEQPAHYGSVRMAAASGLDYREEDFRYYPDAEGRIVTSFLEKGPDGVRCSLRLETTDSSLEGKLVRLSTRGCPGPLVIPHPYPGRDELLFAETYLEWDEFSDADHTPRRPTVFSSAELRGTLREGRIPELETSTKRCLEVDPESRESWLKLLETLLFIDGPTRDHLRGLIKELNI